MIRGLFGDESRRPYRTAGLWVFGYPGFHPGLFSFAPSGSNGEAWRVLNRARKVQVSVRLDPQVLDWLRGKGEGHLTRINDILTNLMEAERRAGSGR
jgi:hypothetical protein